MSSKFANKKDHRVDPSQMTAIAERAAIRDLHNIGYIIRAEAAMEYARKYHHCRIKALDRELRKHKELVNATKLKYRQEQSARSAIS